MNRFFAAVAAASLLANSALAHFVFVLPQSGGTAQVVFSDELAPDEKVAIAKIGGLELIARDGAGNETPIKAVVGKHALDAVVPKDARVVFGSVTYGILQKGDAPAYRLRYHPKAIVGDPFAVSPVGAKVPIEILVVGKSGDVRFQAVSEGKPLPKADITVFLPDGEHKKFTADDAGLTPTFAQKGRFGVWTRANETKAGEADGKKFTETRNYATLVVDVK